MKIDSNVKRYDGCGNPECTYKGPLNESAVSAFCPICNWNWGGGRTDW